LPKLAPESTPQHDFKRRLLSELQPIVLHAAVVIVLELSLLIIGVLTWLLEKLFPKQEAYFDWLERVDLALVFILLILFGTYTMARVTLILWREVLKEWYQK
jgi:uncharacterized protein involved in cysteine biosynthesis